MTSMLYFIATYLIPLLQPMIPSPLAHAPTPYSFDTTHRRGNEPSSHVRYAPSQ